MRAIIRFATVVSVCLMAQGCILEELNRLFNEGPSNTPSSDVKVEEEKVDPSSPRFHINDLPFYRCNKKILWRERSTFSIFDDVMRDGSPAIFIGADICSIGENDVVGDKRCDISFTIPSELFYEGSSVTNSGTFFLHYGGYAQSLIFSYENYYYENGEDYSFILDRKKCGDHFELSVQKFDGMEPGDSVRINFSFKMSFLAWPDGGEYMVLDSLVCKDGVFKEVVQNNFRR